MNDTPPSPVATPQVPTIKRLVVERFRGIQKLVWLPDEGLNLILGGGDVGKTTILDAIALLLCPTNTTLVTDADYYLRRSDEEFCIEGVMSLPESSGINHDRKPAWPWEWDGADPVQPGEEHQPGTMVDAVYRLRVRGTSELDLAYEILQPNEEAINLSVGVRRGIGLVRLGGDDRNDRDLRLVHGSALDRLVGDKTLRSRLAQRLALNDVNEQLSSDAQAQLTELSTAFAARALPTDLSLGLTGGQGLSLNALIGLTAAREGARLPLASWGSGTRRLAALEIAAVNQGDDPIILIDEIERGLEPYRQRSLVAELSERQSQIFVTTHSAAVIRAANDAALWYLDSRGSIGCLARGTEGHRLQDPEAYLARMPVVVEGATEIGFVDALLRRHLNSDLLTHGIVITDGGGNERALEILDALSAAGLSVAGFVDEEGRNPERWKRVQQRLGALLFRWGTGCIEENVVPLVADDQLEAFITPPDGLAGDRLRTLADRLGLEGKDFSLIRQRAADLKRLIIEAATGTIPADRTDLDDHEKKAWRKHAEKWFKSRKGGRELEEKVVTFGLWGELGKSLQPFADAVQQAVRGVGVAGTRT